MCLHHTIPTRHLASHSASPGCGHCHEVSVVPMLPGKSPLTGHQGQVCTSPTCLSLRRGSTWVWYLLSTGLERRVSNSIVQLSGSFQLSLPTSPSSLCKNGDDTTPAPQWEAAKMSAFTCRELSDTGVIITMKQSTEK